MRAEVKFCSQCGGPLMKRFIDPERRSRAVCVDCGSIAYRNPLVLVSTIVATAGKVLLCRRAAPPAVGRWAPPGGFLECGEALEEGAARETWEETGVQVNPQDLRLYTVFTLPDICEVYIGFVAEVSGLPDVICGPECAEARFFQEDDIPWSELAYPDIGNYLRRHFGEQRVGERMVHFGRLDATTVISRSYRVSAVEARQRPREPV